MVDRIPRMVDMSNSPEEAEEQVGFPGAKNLPKYPYGLSISLCEDELEKLGLEEEELCVGDMIHLHSLAKITSVSSYDTEEGSSSRVELVLAYISAENEEEEDEESDRETPRLYRR